MRNIYFNVVFVFFFSGSFVCVGLFLPCECLCRSCVHYRSITRFFTKGKIYITVCWIENLSASPLVHIGCWLVGTPAGQNWNLWKYIKRSFSFQSLKKPSCLSSQCYFFMHTIWSHKNCTISVWTISQFVFLFSVWRPFLGLVVVEVISLVDSFNFPENVSK